MNAGMEKKIDTTLNNCPISLPVLLLDGVAPHCFPDFHFSYHPDWIFVLCLGSEWRETRDETHCEFTDYKSFSRVAQTQRWQKLQQKISLLALR
jgi:hypothetical protein